MKAGFSEELNQIVMNIQPTDHFQPLEACFQSLEADKTGAGTIFIKDLCTSSDPISFGTAITTYSKVDLKDEMTILLTSNHGKACAEIASEGVPVSIRQSRFPCN